MFVPALVHGPLFCSCNLGKLMEFVHSMKVCGFGQGYSYASKDCNPCFGAVSSTLLVEVLARMFYGVSNHTGSRIFEQYSAIILPNHWCSEVLISLLFFFRGGNKRPLYPKQPEQRSTTAGCSNVFDASSRPGVGNMESPVRKLAEPLRQLFSISFSIFTFMRLVLGRIPLLA